MSAETKGGDAPVQTSTRPVWANIALFGLAILAGIVAYFLLPDSMTESQRRMGAIFAIALVLWVTEAIPLFATSLLVIVSQVWLLAIPQLDVDIEYTDVFAALSNHIIYLFLGGFILAKGVQKQGIDVQMASVLLRPFGKTPYGILAGIMLITAVFSMWMSNTATSAMMVVLVAPLAAQIADTDRFRIGLVLGVPFAANIGGIGTPIGTPPNAIALAQLEQRGLEINFLEWMVFSVPLLVGTLVVMWIALLFVFKPKTHLLELHLPASLKLNFKSWVVYITFAVTVALWLTTPIHGVPNAVVAMVPAAVFTITQIISRQDFNRLEWDVLILMAGGIALGSGITATGLDDWIMGAFPFEELSFFLLVAVCCVITVTLSTIISNTVTANIVLPIGLALGAGFEDGHMLQVLAVMIAVSSSYAMGLPISTPPNVIAYGSGLVTSRNIMFVGGLTSVLATILIVTTGPSVVSFLLGLF